mmetsp:Transcript_8512/g.7536  ORF Transcript_8512/g.7536 Transcript_8512/m.7536 type:complete len:97 (+) Transcript_8512:148-438(+)
MKDLINSSATSKLANEIVLPTKNNSINSRNLEDPKNNISGVRESNSNSTSNFNMTEISSFRVRKNGLSRPVSCRVLITVFMVALEALTFGIFILPL